MKYLFVGLLCILLDVNLNLGDVVLTLPPDFLGYIFLYMGLEELAAESPVLARAKPWALGLGIFALVAWVLTALPLSIGEGLTLLYMALPLVDAVGLLYLTFRIVEGIQEMERGSGADLNGRNLFRNWLAMAIAQMAALIAGCFWIPFLSLLCGIGFVVAAIFFLVAIFQSGKRYRQYKEQPKTKGDV